MKILLTLTLLFIGKLLCAQDGIVDTLFNHDLFSQFCTGDDFFNNPVDIAVVQPDGKIIIHNLPNTQYSGHALKGLVRLNIDGSFDESFDTGDLTAVTYPNLKAIALQQDGKLMVSGIDNGTDFELYRLNNDGSIDTTYQTGGYFYDVPNQLIVQPDGKLIGIGTFTYQDENGVDHKDLIRLNEDGTIDTTFTISPTGFLPNSLVTRVVLDVNNRIVIGGHFSSLNQFSSEGLIRLNSDGTTDSTFIVDPMLSISAGLTSLAIQADNKVLISSNMLVYNGLVTDHIIRLTEDGLRDDSYISSNSLNPKGITVMPDSTVVFFENYMNGVQPESLIRTSIDGQVISVGVNSSDLLATYSNMYALETGKFILIGDFSSFNGRYRKNVVRVNEDFSLDSTFARKPGFRYPVKQLLVEPDGKILVASQLPVNTNINAYNDTVVTGLVRLNANGFLDPSFNLDSTLVAAEALALQTDGKILVGEPINNYNNSFRQIVRFDADGTVDNSFVSLIIQGVSIDKLVVQPDGKIMVIGSFNSIGGNPASNIARLNYDGTLDTGFPLWGTDNPIHTCIRSSNGGYFLGGEFNHYNGVVAPGLCLIDSSGNLDNSFTPIPQACYAVDIVQQNDGKLLVANDKIYRLNPNGTQDYSFFCSVTGNNSVNSILLQPDGKVLITGLLTSINNSACDIVVRLNSDGTTDHSFGSDTSYSYVYEGYDMAFLPDGKLVVGGNFSKISNLPASNIAVLHDNPGQFDTELHFSNVSSLNCSSEGAATAMSNGAAPLQYFWQGVNSPASPYQQFSQSGIYFCSVTDASGGFASSSLLIDGPSATTGIDLKVNLAAEAVRPACFTKIFLNALNDGCLPVSGQLICVLDTMLTYYSAYPNPDSQIGDTLIWNFSSITYNSPHLMPDITCRVSNYAQIGDTVVITSVITPTLNDIDTSNNFRTYDLPVVNGYDPNTKSVYPVGKCNEGYIKNDQQLTYTIQFQNTGNSEAVNITVVDTLTPNLDFRGVHIVGSSHPVWIEIPIDNVLKFHFDSINLPDSTSAEALSHGYVMFEIDPIPALPHNTIIANKAEIYFDVNAPIVTNSCKNTIFEGDLENWTCVLGLQEAVAVINKFNLFPNPTKDMLFVQVNDGSTVENLNIAVTDLTGKVLMQHQEYSQHAFALNLSGIANGTYIITFEESGQAMFSSRIVKM